jgi:hypothetical protein
MARGLRDRSEEVGEIIKKKSGVVQTSYPALRHFPDRTQNLPMPENHPTCVKPAAGG